MKRLFMAVMLLMSVCYAETKLGVLTYSTGETFNRDLKLCKDGFWIGNVTIFSILKSNGDNDSYIIKLGGKDLKGNAYGPFEYSAKTGSKFYLKDSKDIVCEVIKISENTMDIKLYLE